MRIPEIIVMKANSGAINRIPQIDPKVRIVEMSGSAISINFQVPRIIELK